MVTSKVNTPRRRGLHCSRMVISSLIKIPIPGAEGGTSPSDSANCSVYTLGWESVRCRTSVRTSRLDFGRHTMPGGSSSFAHGCATLRMMCDRACNVPIYRQVLFRVTVDPKNWILLREQAQPAGQSFGWRMPVCLPNMQLAERMPILWAGSLWQDGPLKSYSGPM